MPLIINGSGASDLPTLDLIGSGTTTNISGLTIGGAGRGQLLLRQGRVLNLGGSGGVSIGAVVGGDGTISVESGAQLLSGGILAVGGTASSTVAGGAGILNIAGGTVDVGTLWLFSGGTINLTAGTLAVNSTAVLDGKFNWTAGTLRFDAPVLFQTQMYPKSWVWMEQSIADRFSVRRLGQR